MNKNTKDSNQQPAATYAGCFRTFEYTYEQNPQFNHRSFYTPKPDDSNKQPPKPYYYQSSAK